MQVADRGEWGDCSLSLSGRSSVGLSSNWCCYGNESSEKGGVVFQRWGRDDGFEETEKITFLNYTLHRHTLTFVCVCAGALSRDCWWVCLRVTTISSKPLNSSSCPPLPRCLASSAVLPLEWPPPVLPPHPLTSPLPWCPLKPRPLRGHDPWPLRWSLQDPLVLHCHQVKAYF